MNNSEIMKKCMENGIPRNVFLMRVNKLRWTDERACTTPVGEYNQIDRDRLKRSGVSYKVFCTRVHSLGWDRDRAYDTPIKKKTDTTVFDREVLNRAKENGIKEMTFRLRVYNGWSIEDACTKPTQKKGEKK